MFNFVYLKHRLFFSHVLINKNFYQRLVFQSKFYLLEFSWIHFKNISLINTIGKRIHSKTYWTKRALHKVIFYII